MKKMMTIDCPNTTLLYRPIHAVILAIATFIRDLTIDSTFQLTGGAATSCLTAGRAHL
jgi:hypothetical protein